MASTPSVIKSKEPDFPLPPKLRKWLMGLLTDTRAIEPREGTNITFENLPDGKKINSSGGGVGSGFETVTGAVAGIPSTLQVATDGNGWTAI